MISSTFRFGIFVAVLLRISAVASQAVCVTQSQPNPIKDLYPNEVTGLLNTTLAIAAIPLKTARCLVPYKILESAYRSLLPDFPKDMYPVLVQAAHDHDINVQGFDVPDFSRVGYEFPFLDLLGNGYTSFRWAPEQLITSTNVIAVQGSEAYGTVVYPATFEPECDAYGDNDETYFEAQSTNGSAFISLDFSPRKKNPTPSVEFLNFFKNVTNQPIFANGTTCDWMTRLFNTSVSEAPFAPVAVKGTVRSRIGPFLGRKKFEGIYGIQIATPFIERNYLDCKTLSHL